MILFKTIELHNDAIWNPNNNKQIKSFIGRVKYYFLGDTKLNVVYTGNMHAIMRSDDKIIKKMLGPDFQMNIAALLKSKFLEAVAMRNAKRVTELLHSTPISNLRIGLGWSIRHSMIDIFTILVDHLGTDLFNKTHILWTDHKFIQLLIGCSVIGNKPSEIISQPDLLRVSTVEINYRNL